MQKVGKVQVRCILHSVGNNGWKNMEEAVAKTLRVGKLFSRARQHKKETKRKKPFRVLRKDSKPHETAAGQQVD